LVTQVVCREPKKSAQQEDQKFRRRPDQQRGKNEKKTLSSSSAFFGLWYIFKSTEDVSSPLFASPLLVLIKPVYDTAAVPLVKPGSS
jgi:hypothetical protein